MDRWASVRSAATTLFLTHRPLTPSGNSVGLLLVESLLTERGYQIARLPTTHRLLGGAWAALLPDVSLAVCDEALTLQRQTFALAHELGHLILHLPANIGESCCDGVTIDPEADPASTMIGVLEVYNPRQQRELEANIFALELLAPPFLLWQLFVQEGLAAPAIASKLDLSPSATLLALSRLLTWDKSVGTNPTPGAAKGTHPTSLGHVASREPPLDLSQRAAVLAGVSARVCLVRAGPGTGKTATLVGRVLHLVRREQVAPRHLLILTFSNRAAGELRTRLASALDSQATALTICTFHSFAHDLLRRYAPKLGLPPNFRVLDTPSLVLFLRPYLGELDPECRISLHRPLNALAGLISIVGRAKDDLLDSSEFRRRVSSLAEPPEDAASQAAFYVAYERLLASQGILDYSDLILLAVRLLQNHPAIRQEVQAAYNNILVDEYQDINRACAELLDLLIAPTPSTPELIALAAPDSHSDGRPSDMVSSTQIASQGTNPTVRLWAVGDPLQSIYRWRGATPEVLDDFKQRYSDAEVLSLAVNYRSAPPIVRFIGGVAASLERTDLEQGRLQWSAARSSLSQPSSDSETQAGESSIILAEAPNEEEEAAGIAQLIHQHIAAGAQPSDHAVLCATHAQADALSLALQAQDVPVSRDGEPSAAPAVHQALAALALAAGQADVLLCLGSTVWPSLPDPSLIYIQCAMSRNGRILTALEDPPADLPHAIQQAGRTLAAFLRTLAPLIQPASLPSSSSTSGGASPQTRTWTAVASFLFNGPYCAARHYLLTEDATSLSALHLLLRCARNYDQQEPTWRMSGLPEHLQLLLSIGEGLGSTDADQIGPGVAVMTVHASKGLEFPFVFVPNLAKGRFPGRGRAGPTIAPGVLYGNEATNRTADDRCLFFVAVSRARDRLILSRARRYGGRDHAPSPLLDLATPALESEPPTTLAIKSDAERHGALASATDPSPESTYSSVEVDIYGLETYLACPRRYYYAHELQLRGVSGEQDFPHFHRTVRSTIAKLHAADRPVEPSAALALLMTDWTVPHEPHPYEALLLQRAQNAILASLVTIAASLGGTATSPIRSTFNVEMNVPRANGVVRVQIDRVDEQPDGAAVGVRYRSGRPSDDHRRQHRTALYHAALESAYGTASVRQEYMLTGAADAVQARASTIASRLKDCDTALVGIATRQFPAKPGEGCPTCPYWLACPKG